MKVYRVSYQHKVIGLCANWYGTFEEADDMLAAAQHQKQKNPNVTDIKIDAYEIGDSPDEIAAWITEHFTAGVDE